MGTRAAFWIGNPEDLEHREWLGCIALDGYPGKVVNRLAKATSPEEFRAAVEKVIDWRRGYAAVPPTNGWPFPWADDIFLTDYTYAFFSGETRMTCFHHGWVSFPTYLTNEKMREAYDDGEEPDRLPSNVPATSAYDRSAPDSIIVVTAK